MCPKKGLWVEEKHPFLCRDSRYPTDGWTKTSIPLESESQPEMGRLQNPAEQGYNPPAGKPLSAQLWDPQPAHSHHFYLLQAALRFVPVPTEIVQCSNSVINRISVKEGILGPSSE